MSSKRSSNPEWRPHVTKQVREHRARVASLQKFGPGACVTILCGGLKGEQGVVLLRQDPDAQYLDVFLPDLRTHVKARPEHLGPALGNQRLRATRALDDSASKLREMVEILQARGNEITVREALAEAVALFGMAHRIQMDPQR